MGKVMALYGSRFKLKLKVKYCITFSVCNLLTRAKKAWSSLPVTLN
ncbi:hypothetical protein LEP1GSC044_0661 [Leptospira kirschneri serovar Grippotyphosa str. RM52]|nr:hypothetical protein LEP1GSC044_0661 [Leptospira kirschneri serovar Grippotyphosa str. RM52]EMK03097.1 hypothetical protein LEP1GSC176_0692 [Leptospira kirschneri str. MMD1493]